jgi:hypothetical protein
MQFADLEGSEIARIRRERYARKLGTRNHYFNVTFNEHLWSAANPVFRSAKEYRDSTVRSLIQ